MNSIARRAVALTLGWLAWGASDASAAWNNVFQTTCCGGNSGYSSYFAPPPSSCCQPSVSYVQRCYYQPVTTYKMETFQEAVTSYRTSYYWAPVTKYRYTSYYDPCTGCTQNVATPCTSYYLRSQCNAVQSYVQRCRMVPVTEMRKSYYLEPVTSCCDTTPSCPQSACGPGGSAPAAGLSESGGAVPRTGDTAEPPRIPKTVIPEASFPRPSLPSGVRPERIASYSPSGKLQGMVVRDDRMTPRPNSTLRFVGDKKAGEVTAKTDMTGRFKVELPPGEWNLYIPGADGKPVFHSQVFVKNADDRLVTVVSR